RVSSSSFRFFLCSLGVPRRLHSFPTRRSSDLGVLAVARQGWRRGELPAGARGFSAYRPRRDSEPAAFYFFLVLYVVSGVIRRERSEEHTSELQSRENLVCRLLLEKKKRKSESQ